MSMDDRVIAGVSRAELERRWSLVRAVIDAERLDVIVAVSGDDHLSGTARWFTDVPVNYRRAVIFHKNDPMTVVDHGHIGSRRVIDADDPMHRGVGELLFTAEFLSVHYTQAYEGELVAAELKKRGHRRVGWVNPGGMPHAFVEALRTGLPGAVEFVDVSDEIDRLMAIKSEEEIALIRRAAAMQDEVFARVVAEARVGMRDLEISALAQYHGRLLGAEVGILLGGSGPQGTAAPMRPYVLQGRTIQAGDYYVLLVENNGPGGYYTELIRLISFGEPSHQLVDAVERTRLAQVETMKHFRPGALCSDIYAEHVRASAALGLGNDRRVYAHGQGYNLVERPLVRFDEPMMLEAGMNMAIHPTLMTPAVFASTCDNHLVTEGGLLPLHTTAQKIFQV
jgi:Xaa-Pro aminopeptidase